jgi:hypothetical protein
MTSHTAHRRQYQRLSTDLPVQVIIADSHGAQVAPIGGPSIPGQMTNISGGGAHVVVPIYLPRATEVELEVPVGSRLPAGRVRARVMLVRMIDREPRYGVGLRFEETDGDVVRAARAAEAEAEEAGE